MACLIQRKGTVLFQLFRKEARKVSALSVEVIKKVF
jgi:hypothetical protein